MITARFEAETATDLDRWAIKWLTGRGYRLESPGEWMTPKAFREKIGICPMTFDRVIHRAGCPDFERHEGPTGRMIRIKATKALEAFCLLHKLNEPTAPVSESK